MNSSRSSLVKRLDDESSSRTRSSTHSSNMTKEKTASSTSAVTSLSKKKHGRRQQSIEMSCHAEDPSVNECRKATHEDMLMDEQGLSFRHLRFSHLVISSDELDAGVLLPFSSRFPVNFVVLFALVTYVSIFDLNERPEGCMFSPLSRMFVLVTVNVFLFIKLNQIDRMTDRLVHNHPVWSHSYS